MSQTPSLNNPDNSDSSEKSPPSEPMRPMAASSSSGDFSRSPATIEFVNKYNYIIEQSNAGNQFAKDLLKLFREDVKQFEECKTRYYKFNIRK